MTDPLRGGEATTPTTPTGESAGREWIPARPPDTLAKGIAQAEAGQTHDLGSFARYASDAAATPDRAALLEQIARRAAGIPDDAKWLEPTWSQEVYRDRAHAILALLPDPAAQAREIVAALQASVYIPSLDGGVDGRDDIVASLLALIERILRAEPPR